jgi:transcriptional regulator with XRE-family HTH domain
MKNHWTTRSTEDFVYRISSDFALQLENKMDEDSVSQFGLAEKLNVSPGRISQILRNPGNLTLKKMVEYARSLGMKVAVVAYEDDDPENKNGPINSQIFNQCWARAGKPRDFFALQETANTLRDAPVILYFSLHNFGLKDQISYADARLTTDVVWQAKKHTTPTIEVGAK